MATLHLLEQGAVLRLRQGRVRVEIDGHLFAEVPARKLSRIMVHGNVRLSTPALHFFMRQGVPVLYLSKQGQLYGLVSGGETATPAQLRAQLLAPEPLKVSLARAFIEGKLRSAGQVLHAFNRKHRTLAEPLAAVYNLLERLEQYPEVVRLRGLEGLGARHYYAGLQVPLAAYGFSGRNRRPPRDPINAALSYGYALLLARVLVSVQAAGLHPEVGFLHAESRRNPSLALDVMEEFRIPVVDLTVFRAFLRGTLQPLAHFHDQQGGIYLNDAGKKQFVPLLEARFAERARHPLGFERSYSELITVQVQRLVAALLKGDAYTAFYLGERS